jgi:hypothetical protein
LDFDGLNTLTVDLNNIVPETDVPILKEAGGIIDLSLVIVDAKKYESPVYSVSITIEIVEPEPEEKAKPVEEEEEEEEEKEKNTASWRPPDDFLNQMFNQDDENE